ncbi:hypothetical protein [Streptomyces sp. NPDC004658]|uniref:hypothetical protein n=1 Tax=Streptomyces sp. NPDC004658 TaxID=3154672 RepID=UPI0033B13CB9
MRETPPTELQAPHSGHERHREPLGGELGPAVRDLVRIGDAWAGRPDLREAFFSGYGRQLTPPETERLALESALDAVSGIQFGATHDDPELVERGRRTLARLRADGKETP